MSPEEEQLLTRIREVQLAQKAKRVEEDPDYDHMPWACWGYEGSDKIADEYGPFVKKNIDPTPEDYATGQRLVDAGLLDGCMCGCRGDMMVTHEGLAALGLEYDPLNEDDGHRPTTILKSMTIEIDEEELDAWRETL